MGETVCTLRNSASLGFVWEFNYHSRHLLNYLPPKRAGRMVGAHISISIEQQAFLLETSRTLNQ